MNITACNKLVGRNLRWIRIYKGLTQQEIGMYLHITFQQVQKYEVGLNRVSAGTILALSTFLNVPIEWFFKEEPFFVRTGI